MQFESPFFDAIWQHKVRFLAVFFVIFTLSYGVLYALDWLPEPKSAKEMVAMNMRPPLPLPRRSQQRKRLQLNQLTMTEEPAVLRIPSLDRVVTVLNPETRDIVALDN
jgi:hypothetical protein